MRLLVLLGFIFLILSIHSVVADLDLNISKHSLDNNVLTVIEDNYEKLPDYYRTLLLEKAEFRGDLLIKYSDGENIPSIEGVFIREIGNSNIAIVKNVDGRIFRELIEDPRVISVEPDQNVILQEDVVHYGVSRVKASDAWSTTTGEGISVGIIDTGIANHPDLAIVNGTSIVGGTYEDTYGHGTQVAGVVAALANSNGLVGVSPSADLYAIKIMNGSSGKLSDAIAGLEWATEQELDIVVMSFGISEYSPIFKQAVVEAYDSGMLMFGASGNDGEEYIMYPARFNEVVAVGAVGYNRELAAFSNYGPQQELVAPGEYINTTTIGGYTVTSGTSFAAPHAAGVAALLWSVEPTLNNSDLRGKLQSAALDVRDIGWDEYTGFGHTEADLLAPIITPTILDENDTGNTTNATIVLLDTISGSIIFMDDYSTEGNSSDGVLWINGELDIALGNDTSISHAAIDAECYDTNGIGSGLGETNYEFCWFPTTTDKTNCEGAESLIDCDDSTDCTVGTSVGDWRSDLFDESEKRLRPQRVSYFDNCAGSLDEYQSSTESIVIMDEKRTSCVNETHYVYEGKYGGSTWITYTDAVQCNGICDGNLETNTSTRGDTLQAPCDNSDTVDLKIESITVMQTLSNVALVKGKSGYVVVNASNSGNLSVNVRVKAWFDGVQLIAASDTVSLNLANPRLIENDTSTLFVFAFMPSSTGSNISVNASVGVATS